MVLTMKRDGDTPNSCFTHTSTDFEMKDGQTPFPFLEPCTTDVMNSYNGCRGRPIVDISAESDHWEELQGDLFQKDTSVRIDNDNRSLCVPMVRLANMPENGIWFDAEIDDIDENIPCYTGHMYFVGNCTSIPDWQEFFDSSCKSKAKYTLTLVSGQAYTQNPINCEWKGTGVSTWPHHGNDSRDTETHFASHYDWCRAQQKVTTENMNCDPSEESGLSDTAIIGIVVAAALVVAGVCAWGIWRRSNRRIGGTTASVIGYSAVATNIN